jgi:hypothetical protein
LTCAGAGVAVMLSGYTSSGQLGLLLAAALAGATAASLALPGPPRVTGALGVGLVGLFGVLISGSFFVKLTLAQAACLLAAPLLCWLAELPYLRRLRPWPRGLAQVVLVAIPVALVGGQAWQRFQEDSRTSPASTDSKPPSIEDYMNFGR